MHLTGYNSFMKATDTPRIAMTVGDMCGIGPEIVGKVLSDAARWQNVDISVIGPEFYVNGLPSYVTAVPVGDLRPEDVTMGVISPRAGQAAVAYVEKAADLCLTGKMDAIVTAPLNKEAMHAAGLMYPGHTEILARRSGTKKYAMAFYSAPLKIMLATIHIPLVQVPGALSPDRLLDTITLAHSFVRELGIARPRIAVAGLNPHAGEHGLFGDEEERFILPAITAAREQGMDVSGPYPGDTVFKKAVDGMFDLVIAQYHDQGLIPLKLLAFDRAVNVTVGLPFVRTSVDHGTAFDIAGKNKADPSSLQEALSLAIRLVRTRRSHV